MRTLARFVIGTGNWQDDFVHVHVCVYVCMYMCVCICVYIYIYICCVDTELFLFRP